MTEMINQTNIKTDRLLDKIKELEKEISEHKAHVSKMTSNTEMPFIAPIKALIDEQITTMYSFINEVTADNKAQKARNEEIEQLV